MQLQQLQMFYPRLHGSKNAAMSLRPHDEQLSPCPGKAAEERLRLFHKSWSNVDNVSGQNAAQDLHRYDAKNAFHFGRVIGKGGYSTVYRVFLRSSDQNDQCDHGGTNNKAGYADSDQAFALKRLQPRIIKNPKLLVTASSDLALEAAILSNLSHENIIKLHGVNDGDMIESLKDGRFFLVLDLLVETLEERLEKWSVHEKRPLFARRSHRFSGITRRLEDSAIGIAKGVEYLHSKNILYRDLKPSNIAFDEWGKVKIFDFGLSREIDESSPEPWQYEATPRFMTGGTGTPRYMAPEVAQNHHFYSFPADVYSFTILLWQIVTTQTPFARISSRAEFAAKVFKKNKRPCLKGIESEPLRNLLETGWAADPDQRPSFSNVHQMLSSIILLPPVASDDRKVR